MNPQTTIADLTTLLVPLAFFMIIRGIAPVLMDTHRKAALLAGFLVPFRCSGSDAFFVGSGRIVPSTMNALGTVTDITGFLIPCAFFVIVRNVVPILVVLDRASTMPARLVMPFSGFLRPTFLMSRRWVIPVPVDFQGSAANVAVGRIPCTVLMIVRHIVPILVIFD